MFFIKIKHSALVQYPGKKQCREKCNSNNLKKHTFALIWAKRLSSFLSAGLSSKAFRIFLSILAGLLACSFRPCLPMRLWRRTVT